MSKTKKSLLILSIFILLGFSFIPACSHAIGVSDADVSLEEDSFKTDAGIIGIMFSGPANFLIDVMKKGGLLILKGSQAFFNLMVGNKVINYSYTGMDNPVIRAGWPITRNLANIIIVLGLLYSGLKTALGLGQYTLKKTFVQLILVALLVNFTLVFCGFIIDAGNVATNYFLGGGGGSGGMSALIVRIGQGFENLSGVEHIIPALSYLAICIITGFVILGFGLIFLLRYIVLWMLVIVSPLVFVLRALPMKQAQRAWDKWWSTFFGWVIIGVPSGFVIMLSSSIMANLKSGNQNYISELFTYSTPILFLLVGLMATLGATIFGGDLIQKGIKSGGKWVGNKVGNQFKKAGHYVKKTTKRETGHLIDKIGKENLEQGARFKGKNPITKTFGWAVRGGASKLRSGAEMEVQDYKDEQKRIKKMKPWERDRYFRNAKISKNAKLARLKVAADEGPENFRSTLKNLNLNESDFKKVYSQTASVGDRKMQKSLERAYADSYGETITTVAENNGIKGSRKADLKAKGYDSIKEKTFLEAKTKDDFKELGVADKKEWIKDLLKDDQTMKKLHKQYNKEQLTNAAQALKKDFVEKFQESMKNLNIDEVWYNNNDQSDLALYLATKPAQQAGLGGDWDVRDVYNAGTTSKKP